jgi:5-methyltetrahydropteroyltriglutamate--homocysteine S-methyltransferase
VVCRSSAPPHVCDYLKHVFRFDSNYHYVVPEFSDAVEFKLNYNKAVEEYKEAKAAGVTTRPVVLGPISFLVLGKNSKDAAPGFQPISLLPKLLPLYKTLLSELKEAGAEWVQIDEPILVLDTAATLEKQYTSAYAELAPVAPKILLATYFSRLDSNLNFVAKLPVAGLHIDLDRAPAQLEDVANAIKPTPIVLSLGLISGRNIWKTDFSVAIKFAQKAIDILGSDRVIIATSSSLLHTPVTLAGETKLSPEQKDWFSFALEKAAEVAIISAALNGSQDAAVTAALEANKVSIAKRREFETNSDDTVRKRVAAITPEMLDRKSPFAARKEIQAKHLNLPKFPTTTIGSFPVCPFTSLQNQSTYTSCSKPRRSVRLVPSSVRARSLPSSTRSSLRRRLRALCASRRRLALTFLFTESLSVTTWFNTLESSSTALFSHKTHGCRATVLGMYCLCPFDKQYAQQPFPVTSVHPSLSPMSVAQAQ